VFSGAPGTPTGILGITGGQLGGNEADSITIQDFNLATAQSSATGFLGIVLPTSLTLTAGTDHPASFTAGSVQSYTIATDAPATTGQIITLTLTGAGPSDFEAIVGNDTVQLGPDGTFTVTLPAGQTNLSFGLLDTSTNDGTSDIAAGATLQLSASISSPIDGSAVQSAALAIDYVPGVPASATSPQPTSDIAGQFDSVTEITTYRGDGGDDAITATGYRCDAVGTMIPLSVRRELFSLPMSFRP
jgi:hypothetical protein